MKNPGILKKKATFSELLLKWNSEQNTRKMPWKGEKDPYKIWLSEIILQQTRVEQGLSYYQNFIKAYPDIHKLAKAPETAIFKLWEGLGYYTRCRNLIATARFIANEVNGKFPSAYDEIKALKGIGPYTAAAISSFAFNLPHAVVDGNVFRVLARIFGIDTPVDTTEGKKKFTGLADELLDKKHAGIYNQAIMDFGAVICKPAIPLCSDCVFNKTCYAFLNKKINALPVKEKRIVIKNRWFYFLVMEYKNKIAVRHRLEKDIWQDLFEFPLIEFENEKDKEAVIKKAIGMEWITEKKYEIHSVSPLLKQKLSHQLISGQFLQLTLSQKPKIKNDWIWIEKKSINEYAFPQFINQYLRENNGRQSLF